MTTQAALDTLVRAARARDWATARAATEALVAAMPAEDAVALARAEVARRLPAFEAHHPDATWARAYLEGAPGGAVVTDDEWPGPGGNNFAAAVEALDRAAHATDATRPTQVVEAIASAIMAELAAAWGARFPERWRRWYVDARGGDEPGDPSALVDMMADEQTAARDVAAWLAVAARFAP